MNEWMDSNSLQMGTSMPKSGIIDDSVLICRKNDTSFHLFFLFGFVYNSMLFWKKQGGFFVAVHGSLKRSPFEA